MKKIGQIIYWQDKIEVIVFLAVYLARNQEPLGSTPVKLEAKANNFCTFKVFKKFKI